MRVGHVIHMNASCMSHVAHVHAVLDSDTMHSHNAEHCIVRMHRVRISNTKMSHLTDTKKSSYAYE